MAEKRKRSQNFTPEEKDKLVKLLVEHKNTIINKKTDGSTNEAKVMAWIQLTASFNATASIHRTKESLVKIWEKMKSESKIYYTTTRRSASQTGGGPSIVKTDPILEQVCSIMGRGCSGIEGISDSDAHLDDVEAKMCIEESYPKVICIGDDLAADIHITNEVAQPPKEAISQDMFINRTPLWSRRRPVSSQNERSEAMGTLCATYKDINKKKEDVEHLKYLLLQEEIKAKQKLYELQIEAAAKDISIKNLEIEIKMAVLTQIKGGGLALQNLLGGSSKEN